MDKSISFELIDVDSSSNLSNYLPSIQKLFLESFGKPISTDLWNWAYQENPLGDPMVSMAFHEDKLIGHYAVIPMDLHDSENNLIKGYLSMTTMVSVDFRRHQLFQTLAERVYDRIKSKNEPSVVFGFPNDQSAPGFTKKLGWTVSDDFHVVALNPPDFEKAYYLLKNSLSLGYRLNLDDLQVANWRTNKPSQKWEIIDGLGVKSQDVGYDLMYMNKNVMLSDVTIDKTLHAIMPVSKEEALELGWEISFPYRFGYRIFNTNTSPTIAVQMCMSDIF